MNRAAFACWNGRIAPVFDVAAELCIVSADAGVITGRSHEPLAEEFPVGKAKRLAALDIETLVCGAISRPLREMIQDRGVRVVPFIAGDLNEIIGAWLEGTLQGDAFAMPGCRGGGRGSRCRRRRRGWNPNSDWR